MRTSDRSNGTVEPKRDALTTGIIGGSTVTISHDRCDAGGFEPTPPQEDALLVHFLNIPTTSSVSVDHQRPVHLLTPAGDVNVKDLRQRLRGTILTSFDVIGFHLPFTVFDELGPSTRRHALNKASVDIFDHVNDPILSSLSHALLAIFTNLTEVSALFVDHLGQALVAHFGQRYAQINSTQRRGRLAAWQERRAKELIAANLNGGIRVSQLATACKLSPSYFSRAFRDTFGVPPHRWLLLRRIEVAKQLLVATDKPIATIATDCGFVDQSHLQRVVTQVVRVTPGMWRRSRGDI
jgi:AraC family transcriptional regulator